MFNISSKSVEALKLWETDDCNIMEEEVSVCSINTPKLSMEFDNTLKANKGKVKSKDVSKFTESSEINSAPLYNSAKTVGELNNKFCISARNVYLSQTNERAQKMVRKLSANSYSVEEKKELWKMCKNKPSVEIMKILKD